MRASDARCNSVAGRFSIMGWLFKKKKKKNFTGNYGGFVLFRLCFLTVLGVWGFESSSGAKTKIPSSGRKKKTSSFFASIR